MASRSPSRWRARLLLGLTSTVLTLLLAEAGLRMAGYRRPQLLTQSMRKESFTQPNAQFTYRGYLTGTFVDFENPVRLNSQAFHDVEHTPERARPDDYRLMVVGDSYVAALSVPLEQTFCRRLEAELNQRQPFGARHYEVIALGRGNQAQAAELRYVQEQGPRYRPDAVLLVFFCGNDFMENSPTIYAAASAFARRYQQEIAPRKTAFFERMLVLPGSRVNGLVAEAATSWYARRLDRFVPGLRAEELVSPELGVYRSPLSPEWTDAYARTGALLQEIKTACTGLSAPLLVAGLVGPQALGDAGMAKLWHAADGLDRGQPERWLQQWCAAATVPYVSLQPALESAGRFRVFWRHDGHLNPYGNGVVVPPLYQLVAAHGRAG